MKALGWYLEEQDLAQVSMNLTDFEVTPLHVAFEECSKDAKVHVIWRQLYSNKNIFSLSGVQAGSGWFRDCRDDSTPAFTNGC